MDYYVQMTNPFNAAERSLISVINYDTASFPFLSGVSQGLRSLWGWFWATIAHLIWPIKYGEVSHNNTMMVVKMASG